MKNILKWLIYLAPVAIFIFLINVGFFEIGVKLFIILILFAAIILLKEDISTEKDSFVNAEIMAHSFLSAILCITLIDYIEKKPIVFLCFASFIAICAVLLTYKEDPEKKDKKFKDLFHPAISIILNFIPAILITLLYKINEYANDNNLTIIENSEKTNLLITQVFDMLIFATGLYICIIILIGIYYSIVSSLNKNKRKK